MAPYVSILTACSWFAVMVVLANESARAGAPWLVVAIVRSGIATLIAAAIAVTIGVRLVSWSAPRMLWIRSLAGSASMLFTFYAIGNMPGSDVLTITNTFPIWVALLSWPLAGEKPNRSVWLAVVFSVAGVSIALEPNREGFRWAPAISAASASFFTAVAMLGINRLKGVAGLAIVVHFSGVSTLAALALLPLQYTQFPESFRTDAFNDHSVLLMLWFVGVTAAVGQVFLTRAYATGSPTKVSVVALSQVLMVMAIEAYLGRKTLTWNVALGTALVLGPVAWLMAHERRKPKAVDEPEAEEVAIE